MSTTPQDATPTGAPGICFAIDGEWWHPPGSCPHCLTSREEPTVGEQHADSQAAWEAGIDAMDRLSETTPYRHPADFEISALKKQGPLLLGAVDSGSQDSDQESAERYAKREAERRWPDDGSWMDDSDRKTRWDTTKADVLFGLREGEWRSAEEMAHLRKTLNGVSRDYSFKSAKCRAQAEEIERLLRALKRHGAHNVDTCASMFREGASCDCGFDAAVNESVNR